MESVLEFSKRYHEDSYKSTRKIFTLQMIWVVFNLSVLCFDWFTFINSPSMLTSFSFGAMTITALLSFIFLLQIYGEMKTEKRHLQFLNELHNTQIASTELRQYIEVKKHYEQLIETLKEKEND